VPTALLSVYDKTGIADLAATLHELGWNLVSSGGTAKVIAERGVPVTDVADLTGVPAILDHRVVTLHPKIHGGLLADPTKPEHRADMEEYGIAAISLVVANLYPFTSQPGIELIDIGGPAMVRAAAKNHAHVAVVVDPADYDRVLAELREAGEVGATTRRRLARDAFAHTAAYDAAIVSWFDATEPEPEVLPRTLHVALERAEILRYGENPHQQGARYRFSGATSWWDTMTQHGGKALSYLNLYDTEAAWRLVHRFDDPACVVVKHANPCGVAIGSDPVDPIADAYVRANACDPVSAFGGIVAVNRTVTRAMAAPLSGVFTEVVVAPGFDDDALEILLAKKNLRVITADAPAEWPVDLKPLDGGYVVQQPDPVSLER
jgi:phosphoribosylaminoimidazolecarboxamide formyltransferase / IMP cyclohydrolase